MSLWDWNVPPLLDAPASDEREAILQVAGLLAGCPDVLDGAGFLEAVFDRQRINPPVLGNGIAMPHARTACVGEIVFAALRLAREVPFGGDAKPVRLVFLFGVPPHRISEYLAATAALVKRLRDPAVMEGLLGAETPEDFMKCLE